MDSDEHPNIRKQRVFGSLYEFLCQCKSGVHQDKMAQELFRAETETRHLVGITENCERAVFYLEKTEEIISVPFDPHGLINRDAKTIWQKQANTESWIDSVLPELDWVHPQYE